MGCLIPNEYQEVEWVQGNGGYINTSYVPTINTTVKLKYEMTSSGGTYTLFGINNQIFRAEVRYTNRWYGYAMGGINFADQSSQSLYGKGIEPNIIYNLSIDENGLTIDDYNVKGSTSAWNVTLPIYLFCGNNASTEEPSQFANKLKVYSFKLFENGEISFDLVPCYRKSDNEIGMYDTVSKQFFTNQGTGTFLKGNDVYHSNVFDLLKTKQKIIMNQPHIETLTGDTISFTTDMKAPLKECKVSFMPVQEGSGDPSPSNVRNITGWNGVSVTRCKKNLIIEDDPLNPNANYSHNSSGSTKYSEEEQGFYDEPPGVSYTAHATGKNGLSYDKVRLFIAPSDMTVVFSIEYKNVGTTYGIRLYKNSSRLTDIHGDADSTWHRYSQVISLSKGDYLKLIIYDKIYWRNIQVEIANSVTDYESYQGTTYSIDWTNDVGTVYGGYVDLVKGELVTTHLAFVMDGTNYTVSTGGAVNATTNMARAHSFIGRTGIADLPEGKYSTGIYASNKYVIHGLNNGNSDSVIEEGVYCGSGTPYVRVVVNADNLSDVSSASAIVNSINEWLQTNPVQVCYQLETPITYQLTPQQLITLKGQNNLWADTNGTTEIKFWKH